MKKGTVAILNQAICVGVSVLGLLFCLPLAAATYYVDPVNGLDTNNGAIGTPFRTLEKARDTVRPLTPNMTGDHTIVLRSGTYHLASTFVLASQDSGTNGYNVCYQAKSGEVPVVSGGRQITGWTLHDPAKNIWKAPASGLNTRQLFVNGIRAVRAHSGAGLTGAVKTTTGYTISNSPMQFWGNQSDMEFVYNGLQGGTGGAKWSERRCGVAGISGTAIAMKQPGWVYCRTDAIQGATYPTDIENAYELLDQPGEWYLDRTAGVVYYKPLQDEDIATAQVIAPVLETLVSGTAVLGTPIHNIRFKEITFAHATWLAPSGNNGFSEAQANNQTNGLGFPLSAVSFKTAQALRFERCVFTQLGGMGLELSEGAQNCVVIGSVFTDISGNCIKIGKVTDPVRTDTRARDNGNQIVNCYIYDAPREYRGGVGIFAGYVSDTVISHNEIAYTSYSAISMGWIQSNSVPDNSYMANNQISYNHIHHFLLNLADGGAIYTLGTQANSSHHHNYVHDLPWAANKTAANSIALYADRFSAYIDIHDNVVANMAGGRWFSAWGGGAHDLQIHDNSTDTSAFLNSATNSTAANNTVVSGGNWPQPALDIMNSAGLESGYQDLLGTVLNFNDYAISGYGGQDAGGTATILDGGATLQLSGNTWKKIGFPYPVTAGTVLEFDFMSTQLGEIHGIGFDNDNVLNTDTFELCGTTSYGRQNYRNYSGTNWVHYVIPVGQFFTGSQVYLYFANDKDLSPFTNNSFFSNVQVHE